MKVVANVDDLAIAIREQFRVHTGTYIREPLTLLLWSDQLCFAELLYGGELLNRVQEWPVDASLLNLVNFDILSKQFSAS